ncbi:MAG: protein-L-isoaspartate(D-aspartate) O-methyltransferase [Candidatus Dadabacteria bacterium]|nr:protein-L-isoaspartate(D-aspartate) O-methyltransferase [Candidatus Dadabacteria bacterium]NIQ16626.1 protein-L-isoaspartate(D-aspartate) O-methyltransferase [Candidatus Dadabacteria bacterium]
MNEKINEFAEKRKEMVEEQLVDRGIYDLKVLEAMGSVPREEFIGEYNKAYAYYDGPLPIGKSQTISQPYIVAYMTEVLNLKNGDKVLEIGTGSGYQTAILAEMGCEVFTIEIIRELAEKARIKLDELGYKNINYRIGDGYQGWEEYSPYDAILVAATAPELPNTLVQQLKVGGKMVIPVQNYEERLKLIQKKEDGLIEKVLLPVRFVKMTGKVQEFPKESKS